MSLHLRSGRTLVPPVPTRSLSAGHPPLSPDTRATLKRHFPRSPDAGAMLKQKSGRARLGKKRDYDEDWSPKSENKPKRRKQDTKQDEKGMALLEISQQIRKYLGFLKIYLDHFQFVKAAHADDPWYNVPDGPLYQADFMSKFILVYSEGEKKDVDSFVCNTFPIDIVKHLRDHNIKFPTWADVRKKYPSLIKTSNDLPAPMVDKLLSTRKHILDLAAILESNTTPKPKPSDFSKPNVWRGFQKTGLGLLCHRPGLKRPYIPLKLMHPSFYTFVKGIIDATAATDSVLKPFRVAAQKLTLHLTNATDIEMERCKKVAAVLEEIFPSHGDYEWKREETLWPAYKMDLLYQKRVKNEGEADTFDPIIVIELKVEEGKAGDPYMQIGRYFDGIVDSYSRCRETGAPTYLITMAGPNINFCGGWSDYANRATVIDIFKTMFVCMDAASESREDLARALYSLKKAIALLPSPHIIPPGSSAVTGVPAVFDNYEPDGNEGPPLPLKLLTRLPADARHTVFFAYAKGMPNERASLLPADKPIAIANCVAKLVYRGRYGYDVHRALAPDYAPRFLGISSSEVGASLVIMEYLAPPSEKEPGWIPLSELLNSAIEIDSSLCLTISDLLDGLLHALGRGKFVHGDLRASNIMIAMADLFHLQIPAKIKAVDFEWADVVGKAYYPDDRSPQPKYPGMAGDLIVAQHDNEMIKRLKKAVWSKFVGSEGSEGEAIEVRVPNEKFWDESWGAESLENESSENTSSEDGVSEDGGSEDGGSEDGSSGDESSDDEA